MHMKKKRRVVKRVVDRDGQGRYLFWFILLGLVILSYFVLKPYLIALISAFILAYLIKPLNDRFQKKLSRSMSAALSVIIVSLILILPIGLVAFSIAQQAQNYLASGGLESILRQASSSVFAEKFNIDFSFLGVDSPLASLLSSALSYVPTLLISVFITLFGMYYILLSWDDLVKTLKGFIPFKNKNEIGREISEITNIIVYGTLAMALVEFIIGAAGFYVLGVKFYLLLAMLLFFLAFIPALGPALVWVPMFIYYVIIKNYYVAGGVLVIGLVLSLIVDTILRAKILGDRSRINPLVMIVGLLGGITVFGIFGFIIGPLILLYTIEILKEVSRNRR
jgi:predicted PurR-regulated permease PerM